MKRNIRPSKNDRQVKNYKKELSNQRSSFDPVDMEQRQRRYYNDEYTGEPYFDDNYEPRNARRSEESFSARGRGESNYPWTPRQSEQDQPPRRRPSGYYTGPHYAQPEQQGSSGYGGHYYGAQPNYERTGGYQSYRGGYGFSGSQGGYPISQGTGYQSGDFGHGGGMYGEYQRYNGGYDLSRETPEQQRLEFRGKGPKGYQRGDERLTDDVCERLSQGHLDATGIEVHVKEGIVTLEGHVHSRRDKRLAEDLIENIFGIKDVINHLRIERETLNSERSDMDRREYRNDAFTGNPINSNHSRELI